MLVAALSRNHVRWRLMSRAPWNNAKSIRLARISSVLKRIDVRLVPQNAIANLWGNDDINGMLASIFLTNRAWKIWDTFGTPGGIGHHFFLYLCAFLVIQSVRVPPRYCSFIPENLVKSRLSGLFHSMKFEGKTGSQRFIRTKGPENWWKSLIVLD